MGRKPKGKGKGKKAVVEIIEPEVVEPEMEEEFFDAPEDLDIREDDQDEDQANQNPWAYDDPEMNVGMAQWEEGADLGLGFGEDEMEVEEAKPVIVNASTDPYDHPEWEGVDWDVEDITGCCVRTVKNGEGVDEPVLSYYIKWEGYHYWENTWEPRECLEGTLPKLHKFHRENAEFIRAVASGRAAPRFTVRRLAKRVELTQEENAEWSKMKRIMKKYADKKQGAKKPELEADGIELIEDEPEAPRREQPAPAAPVPLIVLPPPESDKKKKKEKAEKKGGDAQLRVRPTSPVKAKGKNAKVSSQVKSPRKAVERPSSPVATRKRA